jgi:trans-aconitate methyltransferase
MHEAHRPVIEVVKTITQAISRSYWRVLDLGCGDGTLLRKLTDIFPHVMPQGVEVDANKCLASNLHFDKVRIVRHANIKNFDISQAHPDIILCSIERLKEDSNLSQRLYSAGCKLILYDYLKVPTYVDIQG